MKRFAVVFDTNSYRQFVWGRSTQDILAAVSDLKLAESKKDITAFGLMIVGMEMLGNIAEGVNGFNYRDCLLGVIAMSNHCFDGSIGQPRIIPQPYLHLSKVFFGTVPTDMEQRVKNMGGVINDFRIDYNKALEHHKKESTFNNIKDFIESEETTFSLNIENLIDQSKLLICTKYPKALKRDLRNKLLDFIENGTFEPMIAIAIIIEVAQKLERKLTFDEIVKMAFTMNIEFPLSCGFHRWICTKIVKDNIDMQSKTSKAKRWNWLWDYQVSFLLSGHTIGDREVILVTSDGDMTDMLAEFGYKNRVFNLSEYLNFINEIK